MTINANNVSDILNTDGPLEYSALLDQYIRTRDDFLIIYGVTRKHSL